MIAVLKPITVKVIQRPEYVQAETFVVWKRLNHWRLWDYWEELNPGDDEGTSSDFLDFTKSQYDVHCALLEENDDVARVFRTADEAAAYEAGVPARGPL